MLTDEEVTTGLDLVFIQIEMMRCGDLQVRQLLRENGKHAAEVQLQCRATGE